MEYNINKISPKFQLIGQQLNKLKYAGDKKQEKSHEFFRSTKVDSCSYVKLNKYGIPQAIAYYKHNNLDKSLEKSFFNQSTNSEMFKLKSTMRCGMDKKPLIPYCPNSYRNRLPVLELKRLHKNVSTIELGDRRFNKFSSHVSYSQDIYGHFGKNIPVSNTGIQSEINKWHHKLIKL